MRKAVGACLLAALVAFGNANATPTLQVEAGILVGAKGVNVDGKTYDVSFNDDTCIALFSGCDEASDFPFLDGVTAEHAAAALLDSVFVDGPAGAFDSSPSLVRGCPFLDGCWALTPYGIYGGPYIYVALARNVAPSDHPNAFDLAYTGTLVGNSDPVGGDPFPSGTVAYVYAVWTCASCTSIPEAPTNALFVAGLVVFLASKRRTVPLQMGHEVDVK